MDKHFRQPLIAPEATIFLVIIICSFWIFSCESVSAANYGRPSAEDGPTEVKVALFVIDIDDVDNANQSFEANVFIEIRWRDARLAHDHPNEIARDMKDIWNPRLQFLNQQKIWPTLPDIAEIFPDGEVVYQQRVWGIFSQPLALKDFPFDRQLLQIQLVSAGYSTPEVKLVPDSGSRTGISSQLALADWDILGWKTETGPFALSLDEASFAGFYFTIQAERKYGYFITKVILPLVLIVMMSWVVFWIDPRESGTQISVAITAMLTLIAYRFAVGTDLPKVSYLSRLDYFILSATLLVFASLIEVVVTSTYAKVGEIEYAQAIDRWARILFPAVFIALTFGSLVFGFGFQ